MSKYTKLKFDCGKFYNNETDSMNGYTKNRLYTSFSSQQMYVDTDKLEIGKKKFKIDLLNHNIKPRNITYSKTSYGLLFI